VLYRSGFEGDVAFHLEGLNIGFEYESRVVHFEQPSKSRRYTPDFILPNGIILEVKGYLTVADRQKHKWIKEQHPDLDLRFVFMKANTKLNKRSKTRYRDWADKLGILWCQGPQLPHEWTHNCKASKHINPAPTAEAATHSQ
jgi:hypothetical protein